MPSRRSALCRRAGRGVAGLALGLLAAAGARAAEAPRPQSCSELKTLTEPRRTAEKIWRSQPDIGPARLAEQAGVPTRRAREWLEGWRRAAASEERECKLYPGAAPGGDGAGASVTGTRRQEQIDEFVDWLEGRPEQAACGPRPEACFYFIVDCRLRPRLRRIGRRMPSITPRRWVRTTAGECQRRGGSFERPDAGAAPAARPEASPFLLVVRQADGAERQIRRWAPEPAGGRPTAWERDAHLGKPCAQNYLGETLRRQGRYEEARSWFSQAAAQGHREALINLGTLYEEGLVEVRADPAKAPAEALACYRAATGHDELLLELDEDASQEIRTRAAGANVLERPRIEILEPWLSLREREAYLEDVTSTRVFGRVFASTSVKTIDFDGNPMELGSDATFEKTIEVRKPQTRLKLAVQDHQNKRHEVELTLLPGSEERGSPSSVEARASGRHHALLIGIDEYYASAFEPLETPVSDVEALSDALEEWTFEPQLLTDDEATLEEIMRRLDGFRRTLGPDDNLLVYFAGHGAFFENATPQEGFWIPADAEDDLTTWISNRQLALQLETIQAGHILVLADSCFSGFLTRAASTSATGSRSVAVLTSADETAALDSAPGGRSPFARAVLYALTESRDALPASRLADAVKTAFSDYRAECSCDAGGGGASERFDAGFCEALCKYGQTPVFKPVGEAGHEGGEFTFER